MMLGFLGIGVLLLMAGLALLLKDERDERDERWKRRGIEQHRPSRKWPDDYRHQHGDGDQAD